MAPIKPAEPVTRIFIEFWVYLPLSDARRKTGPVKAGSGAMTLAPLALLPSERGIHGPPTFYQGVKNCTKILIIYYNTSNALWI